MGQCWCATESQISNLGSHAWKKAQVEDSIGDNLSGNIENVRLQKNLLWCTILRAHYTQVIHLLQPQGPCESMAEG